MFTDELSENWCSTEGQDTFIRKYFGKGKVLPERCHGYHHKNATVATSQIKNKHSLNDDVRLKKRKCKESSTEDECSISDRNLTTTELKVSQATDLVSQKLKKKRKKSKNKITLEEQSFIDKNSQDHCSITDGLEKQKSKKKRRKAKKKNVIACEEQSDKIFNNARNTLNITDTVSNSVSMNKNILMENKFHQKLQAAKFRYLNEMLYTNDGKEALSYFQQNTDEFHDYHAGYQLQVSKWPVNPVDIIIQEIHQTNKEVVVADLGCGEAKIAEALSERTVHSFDLIALKDSVIACDIANVPLPNNSVDVAVFCLSLMGRNWKDYIREGHRILKLGAILKVAEIESRIEELGLFIKNIECYGFTLENKNLSHKMFIFLNFKKIKRNKNSSKVPDISLKPCLYKKR